jgi:hypothetical protein
MAEFRAAIRDICAEHRPLTARQCYYRAVVSGLVDKDTGRSRKNEQMVGAALDHMREEYVAVSAVLDRYGESLAGELSLLPMEWLADNTRVRYQADLHGSSSDALAGLAAYYRRDLWRSQPRHVEVWCESDSIGGVILDVTDAYGVAMLPARGQSGKRFVWDSAQSYRRAGKPVTVLYVGDFDPAGLDIGNSIEDRLARYGAPDDLEFRRLAVTPWQVSALRLPGHGLNPNHPEPVLARFRAVCDEHGLAYEAVEAEALPPETLRLLVRDAIGGYIDRRQWDLELAVERSERDGLAALAAGQEGGL